MVPSEKHRNDLGSGVNHRSGWHADQDNERGNCHHRSCDHPVAILKEFRDRVDATPQQFRQKNKGDHHEGNGCHPLIRGNGHPKPVGGLTRHADKLLGGNIGGNQREAHQPPRQPASSQEVSGGTSGLRGTLCFFVALPDAEGDDADDSHEKENHVESAHGAGFDGRLS